MLLVLVLVPVLVLRRRLVKLDWSYRYGLSCSPGDCAAGRPTDRVGAWVAHGALNGVVRPEREGG